MIRICSTLHDNGYDVTLVGRQLTHSPALQKRSFKQHRIPCRFTSGPLFYLEYNIRLFLFFIRVRPDIINTVDLDTVVAARWYQVLTKTRWIFDAHEHFTEVPEVTDRPLIKWIWGRVERMVFKNADKFYTVSVSISEIYQKIYKKNVEVIRNVPFLRSSNVVKPQSEQSEQGIFIYQGALNLGRCVDLYIKAMHNVDGELWLVGEGDLSEELRALATREKLEHKVRFYGRVEPEELHRLTLQADIGLNVLENKGLSYYYSLSNKCFDYIQAEKPSISSAFPEYQILNEEYDVMLLAEPSLESVTSAMNRLLHDKALYHRLSNNCKPAAKTWNWENELKKLLKVYE
jgi:glycosyltransferase involved in cell wall biosynthesis